MDINLVRYENRNVLVPSGDGFDPDLFCKQYLNNVHEFGIENESPGSSELSDNGQSSSEADDVLRNGILLQTHKGVICISLNDALTSNLNLSVDDFKNVAAQLLTQESGTDSEPSEHNGKQELTTANLIISNADLSQEKCPLTVQIVESNTTETSEDPNVEKKIATIVKRRGGWPKGRKRKPELLNLPPKAPKTSYNIFLNEHRKLYKDKLAFHEITRVVGNQWSNLSADEKRPYLERAEEDKKRYREELRAYRQSDAYKLYLARKRKKRMLDNLWSESDMDGTDDIDEDDNDVLYCDTCDQWFYTLHNKREHLLSKQHKLAVAGFKTRKTMATSTITTATSNDNSELLKSSSSLSFSTSLDESSLDATTTTTTTATPIIETNCPTTSEADTVYNSMMHVLSAVKKRENEMQTLNARLQRSIMKKNLMLAELNTLKERSDTLESSSLELKREEIVLEQQLFRLWNVPSLFIENNYVKFINNVEKV